jgi:hypothetical protein
MGFNAVQPAESQLTFRRNMSPPSSASNKTSEKKRETRCKHSSASRWFLA